MPMKPTTLIADLRHYLDKDGTLTPMPGPAIRLATFLCAIVSWTTRSGGSVQRTNVWCRRSPSRKPCANEIIAAYGKSSSDIFWECPGCGDSGLIKGWIDTTWDRSGRS